jgi:hypothetical protein
VWSLELRILTFLFNNILVLGNHNKITDDCAYVHVSLSIKRNGHYVLIAYSKQRLSKKSRFISFDQWLYFPGLCPLKNGELSRISFPDNILINRSIKYQSVYPTFSRVHFRPFVNVCGLILSYPSNSWNFDCLNKHLLNFLLEPWKPITSYNLSTVCFFRSFFLFKHVKQAN